MKKLSIFPLLVSTMCALGLMTSVVSAQLPGSLSNGLVAYYTFDGTFANLAPTVSIFNNQGATFGSGFLAGSQALSFTEGQYGTVEGLGSYISNSVTVSAWYKFSPGRNQPLEYGSGFKAVPFSGTLPDGSNPTFRVNVSGSPFNYVDLNLGDGTVPLTSTGYQVSMDQWYYLTVVASGGPSPSWAFYVNGVSEASGTGSVPNVLNFNYSYGLGATIDGGDDYFGTQSRGLIDNIAFYDRALSPTDVQDLYNAEAVPEPSTYALLLLSGAASLYALKRRKS
jgi:hypothetical protein